MFSEKEQEIINSAKNEALGIERLARAYYEGNSGFDKDMERAGYYACMSVWKGNPKAATLAGYCHLKGIGIEKDYTYAFLYYLHAAKAGSPTGQYVVGKFYSDEKFAPGGICPINYYTAHLWFEMAAEQGDVDAMVEMGVDFYYGKGTVFDLDKALFWFEKGAEKGNITAMLNAARFYHGSEGIVYEDENKAGYWWNEAAQRGNKDAQEMLKSYKYSSFSKRWKKIE